MAKWLGEIVEADVRVGGRYHFRLRHGASVYDHSGQYLALDPRKHVRMSFTAAAPDAAHDPHATVNNEFIEMILNPIGDCNTELIFINGWDGWSPSLDEVREAKAAWNLWLDRMEASLA